MPATDELKKNNTCKKATFFDDIIPGIFRRDQYSSFNYDDLKKEINVEFRCIESDNSEDIKKPKILSYPAPQKGFEYNRKVI